MNLVKKLTRQGCMIDREASNELTEKDVQLIQNLEATPMYVNLELLYRLREIEPPCKHRELTLYNYNEETVEWLCGKCREVIQV